MIHSTSGAKSITRPPMIANISGSPNRPVQIADEYAGDRSRGCFCNNTMVELAHHDEKFEILIREHQMYLSVIFQETIERGVQSGELKSSIHAKSLAQALIVSLIGLTVILKARPERSFIDQSIAVTLTLLDSNE